MGFLLHDFYNFYAIQAIYGMFLAKYLILGRKRANKRFL